jgi:dipeptidyl aminopeptidase/acylaminoacyl peptidase
MPETTFEDRIREALHAEVDRAQFRPLGLPAATRARRRLVRNAVAASVLGLVVVAGAAAGIAAFATPMTTQPGGGGAYVPTPSAACCLPPVASLVYEATDGSVRYLGLEDDQGGDILHSSEALDATADGVLETTPDGWLELYAGGHDFEPISRVPDGLIDGAIAPDGTAIAFTTDRGLFTLRIEDGAKPVLVERARAEMGVSLTSPTWSPDGTRIAFVRSAVYASDLEMLDLTLQHASTVRAGVSSAAWSPDGRSIAVFGTNGDALLLIDAATGAPSDVMATASSASAPAWSPDGAHLAFIGTDGAVTIVESDGSGAAQVQLPDARSGSPLFWVPGTTGG